MMKRFYNSTNLHNIIKHTHTTPISLLLTNIVHDSMVKIISSLTNITSDITGQNKILSALWICCYRARKHQFYFLVVISGYIRRVRCFYISTWLMLWWIVISILCNIWKKMSREFGKIVDGVMKHKFIQNGSIDNIYRKLLLSKIIYNNQIYFSPLKCIVKEMKNCEDLKSFYTYMFVI